MKKSELIAGKKYHHRFRGDCVFTPMCEHMEKINPDPTSVYMQIEGDIIEVSLKCIEEIPA